MELSVGMYVRTKNGYIRKIERKALDNEGFLLDEEYYNIIIEEETFGIIPKEDVSKASHNIIDLIEAGDYVNGEKVFEVLIDRNMSRVKTELSTFFESDIKSIVTKEMFSSVEYKVETN